MPVPTTYTEAGFANYLASVLGEVAGVLGWDAGSVQVIEALNDTLLEYGETTITNIVGANGLNGTKPLRHLRALGRRSIWRAVKQATASKYQVGSPEWTLQRQQIHDHAVEEFEMANTECLEFDPMYAVSIVGVKRSGDPYIVLPDAERIP
jgi:hypothetical protein